MKNIHWFMCVLILTFSQVAHAAPQTLELVGTDLPIGDIDPYSEGSTDNGLTWGPTYSVGTHPFADLPGVTGWVNVYPCQGDEVYDLLDPPNVINDPSAQCGPSFRSTFSSNKQATNLIRYSDFRSKGPVINPILREREKK